MNTDELYRLLLRLLPGGALVLPAKVDRQAVENAKEGDHKEPDVATVGASRRYPRIER